MRGEPDRLGDPSGIGRPGGPIGRDVLRNVRSSFDTPILMVSHDLEECFALADRMFVLSEGKLAQQGTPTEIYDKPASVGVARQLGIYNLIQAFELARDGLAPPQGAPST